MTGPDVPSPVAAATVVRVAVTAAALAGLFGLLLGLLVGASMAEMPKDGQASGAAR